jgi:hypothetical protein
MIPKKHLNKTKGPEIRCVNFEVKEVGEIIQS